MHRDIAEDHRVDAAQTPGAARNGKRLQAAQNLGRIVEINLVDDARLERSPIHLAPGLDHEGLIFMFGKPLDDGSEVGPPSGPIKRQYADAAVLERSTPIVSGRRSCHDSNIAGSRANHLRVKRSSKLGIDDDAQKRPAAGFSAPIREEAIVRKQRPDARENRVGCVAKALHVRREPSHS